ncbi:hypothetical protein AMECASPLE_011673 [Ameca splendens]|uniref:Uncharacterized protein n=1 Tax=Ameca splendens TaxID=208324 RepID=A0ABV0YP81_9TELE
MCVFMPDSVTPVLSGGMTQNTSKVLWEACGKIPKMFDPIIQLRNGSIKLLFLPASVFDILRSNGNGLEWAADWEHLGPMFPVWCIKARLLLIPVAVLDFSIAGR